MAQDLTKKPLAERWVSGLESQHLGPTAAHAPTRFSHPVRNDRDPSKQMNPPVPHRSLVSPKKIHILGGPGSGKTTLGKNLAAICGAPHFDLDPIAWGTRGKVPLKIRQSKIDAILALPAWISEGNYLWWTQPLMEQADGIIWLDLPFPLTAWRIIRRHTLASLKGNNPHAGLGRLAGFLAAAGRQHTNRNPIQPSGPDDDFAVSRAATALALAGYEHKLWRCRRPGDIARLVQQLTGQNEDER